MPSLALSEALRDFGSRPTAAVVREPSPIELMPPTQPTIDIDGIVAAEVEKTEASVTERLQPRRIAAEVIHVVLESTVR